ncbi:Gfo/Idh/MocA family oxidoreductase [Streptomyces sp. CB01881]|uniref:Gfo/Idh/MocA family protein n=1 Tax=Streptomyces sp. CB01881 TaxID=2078691 RepID=UPI000CDC06A8|nr:Gfo/Idh/MocA family oxidoreductase [Streptomyces sp. CB01881]AUY50259.1 dehydrogenase [Streptomyces sp. CB01881]TYC73647.1 gfo/Idh/MocA family oxidoreductase [Streptomyces sp. CB01881]
MKRRAAVIGLGHQAREDHLPGLLGSGRAELVAVCDSNPELLHEWQELLQVPSFTRAADLLDAVRPDFVIVAVPHHAGRGVIEECSTRGVHVLKEKPFATSLSEARELAAICEAGQVELMVALQRRFNPIYTSVLQLLDQIGTPFLIDGQYTFHTEDPGAGWRGDVKQAGGGCIIDMGYHLIDLLLWYFGMPSRVIADFSAAALPEAGYDAEDTAVIQLGYDGDLYGSVLLSRWAAPKTEKLHVVGTRGSVLLTKGHVQRLDLHGSVVEELTRPQAPSSAATAQIDYFCRVLDGERPNTSGPDQHLAHAAFVASCYESKKARRYIDPKEML